MSRIIRMFLIISLFGIFVLLSTLVALQNQVSNETFKNRAVSLKVLEERLKECMPKGECSQNLIELCGLTKIDGYVMDEENNDIILIGRLEAGSPPLYLEDFVIALRNTWWKYATVEGNTRYYESPGCSIDPDPGTLQKLQQIGQAISSTSEKLESSLQTWQKICSEPQQVRVFGIPFDTRFAKVMVEADYLMKRIVDGSDSLGIDGFESLTDMLLNKAKEDLTQDKPISISFLNRFWFFSREDEYIEDKGVVFIKKCEVRLLTEEEFLSKTGEVSGTGQSNPLAQIFSEKFTEKYSQIAMRRPIYAELERLFRYVTIAKVMEEKEVLSGLGLDLDYLLNQYPVRKTSVDHTLPGISNVKRFEYTRDYPDGYEIVQLALPSCGGVSMSVKINPENFVEDKTGQVLILKKNVLKTRSAPDALYWDFPLSHLGE